MTIGANITDEEADRDADPERRQGDREDEDGGASARSVRWKGSRWGVKEA